MHVLFVTYSLPYPPDTGAKLRDFQFLRHLAKQHQVTCFCLTAAGDDTSGADALRGLGITLHLFRLSTGMLAGAAAKLRSLAARWPAACADYFEPGMFAAMRDFAAANPVDFVQIEHSFMAPYLKALPQALRARSLLDLHHIETTRRESLARLPKPPKIELAAAAKAAAAQDWEVDVARAFAGVSVVSKPDAAWLRARAPTLPVHVLDNGVDIRRCVPLPPDPASKRVLFVGTMAYGPNADAMHWFCEAILPLLRPACPGLRVDIVGRDPAPEVRALTSHSGVRVHGGVPDLEPFYRRAAVVVVPLRAGGGTRLKILEAMAFGRVVVSTRLGCEGLDVVDGEHLLVADEAQAFAAHVAALLASGARRDVLAHKARDFVEKRHDWRTICTRLSAHVTATAAR